MADFPVVMRKQQYEQIKTALAKLQSDCCARLILLIDKNGQQIAMQGDADHIDTTGLASLAAGNVAATGGMACLIGEKEFPTLSHEGKHGSIYICIVSRALLVVVFDERSSLGLVKLRTRQSSRELVLVFEEVARQEVEESPGEESLFAEITDEDIDSLFR